MKYITAIMLLLVVIINSSCEKGILGKTERESTTTTPEPEAKYYGIWKADKLAIDVNSNNRIDTDEYFAFNGTSSLNLSKDKKYTYSLTTSSGNTTMSGNWTTSADVKSITINDASQGNVRFDYRSDTEIQTEPLATNSGTAWIIYKKQ